MRDGQPVADGHIQAVFFDLFGTLLPLGPLDQDCERLAPGRGREIARAWRARQIEATWLRTIMDRWADLDAVTLDALRAVLEELEVRVDERGIAEAAGAFGRLALDPAAAYVIGQLRDAGLTVGILTNASRSTVNDVVARLPVAFDHVLSVDAVRRYKPHPAVYQLAVDAVGAPTERIGFVTANGWDATGAASFGFRVAWLAAAGAALPAVEAPPPRRATWAELRETPSIGAPSALRSWFR